MCFLEYHPKYQFFGSELRNPATLATQKRYLLLALRALGMPNEVETAISSGDENSAQTIKLAEPPTGWNFTMNDKPYTFNSKLSELFQKTRDVIFLLAQFCILCHNNEGAKVLIKELDEKWAALFSEDDIFPTIPHEIAVCADTVPGFLEEGEEETMDIRTCHERLLASCLTYAIIADNTPMIEHLASKHADLHRHELTTINRETFAMRANVIAEHTYLVTGIATTPDDPFGDVNWMQLFGPGLRQHTLFWEPEEVLRFRTGYSKAAFILCRDHPDVYESLIFKQSMITSRLSVYYADDYLFLQAKIFWKQTGENCKFYTSPNDLSYGMDNLGIQYGPALALFRAEKDASRFFLRKPSSIQKSRVERYMFRHLIDVCIYVFYATLSLLRLGLTADIIFYEVFPRLVGALPIEVIAQVITSLGAHTDPETWFAQKNPFIETELDACTMVRVRKYWKHSQFKASYHLNYATSQIQMFKTSIEMM